MTKKHGKAERAAWNNMIRRCYNPKASSWQYYGEIGIQVCEKWRDRETGFQDFYSHVGPRPSPLHSLDRINTYGHYEEGNVKWSTKAEQVHNRRPFKDRLNITIHGVTKTASEWSKVSGVSRNLIKARLRRGINQTWLLHPGSLHGVGPHLTH